jgi:S1-C subfamily serine protease
VRAVLISLVAVALGVGCEIQASAPPSGAPTYTIADVAEVADDVSAAEDVRLPTLARDSQGRQARRLTLRVRNIGCAGVGTGSGFALGDSLLVTNRHVLAGADALEVSTWNGRNLRVDTAVVGVLGDVGFAVIDGKLPLVGRYGRRPNAADPVTAVGYPLGGPVKLSRGTVVDRVEGAALGIPGEVVRLTARVRPGNSGGPVLDRKGRVVGIVYGIEVATRYALAIPVDTIRRLTRAGGFESVPPCGAD